MKKIFALPVLIVALVACQKPSVQTEVAEEGRPQIDILLRNYNPVNVNNIPQTYVEKARYAVLDMHAHDYAATPEEVTRWVANMDACGIEKTNVMHCSWIGEDFETVLKKYEAHKDRFNFWCCFDYSHYGQEDFAAHCIAQLVKAHDMGAIGVGELGDKGMGDTYARPVPGEGIHIDDPALSPVLDKCAELDMPISIHIAEPYWMYLPLDSTNDGLMNAGNWHIDTSVPGIYDYDQLIQSFENAVAAHPNTTFIACHYLNMNQDYQRLGALLDKYPNLYVDISARVAESAQVPRATRAFLIKYQDRVLFGTDNGMEPSMYRTVFRTLETEDEHYYVSDFGYHWHLSAFYLPDEVLKKLYRTNAEKVLGL